MPHLSSARYGKDNVRVCKVARNPDGTQDVTEMTVRTLLEGDIAASWTHADNANIVATDTQKQTVYITAKLHPVNPPELFAATLASHFVDTYPHLSAAHVSVTVHRWTRLSVDGAPHPHTFLRDGVETRVVEAVARRASPPGGAPPPSSSSSSSSSSSPSSPATIELRGGIKGLLVLKSTGSQFWGFHRDAYTRLPETRDRMLSTEVEAGWAWKKFVGGLAEVRAAQEGFDRAWGDARRITLDTFAREDSPSVQNTMYLMAGQILEAVEGVEEVEYSLPNKHYFEIDLSWFEGLKNTGADAEVYAPQSDPNGLIQCTVTRSGATFTS